MTDDTVGAVTTDNVLGAYCFALPIGKFEVGRDAGVILDDIGSGDGALDADAVLGETFIKELLSHGLRDIQGQGEFGVSSAQVVENDPRGEFPLEVDGAAVKDAASLDDGVGGSMAVQKLESPGLHNQCAALIVPDRFPVDDAKGNAMEGELERKGGADRARSHHQNVDVVRHGDWRAHTSSKSEVEDG
jgi:hypothetical protein